jgi:hypothetical protein
MTLVLGMTVTVVDVVDVVAVVDGRVPTIRAVAVTVVSVLRMRYVGAFVPVTGVFEVGMPLVEVVDVVIVLDGGMAAVGPMGVGVVLVGGVSAHGQFLRGGSAAWMTASPTMWAMWLSTSE